MVVFITGYQSNSFVSFSVDKLITEPCLVSHLYFIVVFFFLQDVLGQIYQHPRMNAIPRDRYQ